MLLFGDQLVQIEDYVRTTYHWKTDDTAVSNYVYVARLGPNFEVQQQRFFHG
jgi:hypothetical protein